MVPLAKVKCSSKRNICRQHLVQIKFRRCLSNCAKDMLSQRLVRLYEHVKDALNLNLHGRRSRPYGRIFNFPKF